ncbi:spermatogenesis-associated protein 6 isoform X6 [Chelonia mydas]|uniref:spermatogenesis-associated protein 6 isoform X6 n=1 Tax=Chelonia mydas TaxID=8469 RepID=UPI001CA92464|nr:spermatogenesis-associated protein 6 isoform X6 [Chelonia mydas]
MVASGNVPVATTTALFPAGGAERAPHPVRARSCPSPSGQGPGQPPARPGPAPPMPRKALVCALELELRSITCPGVLLKDKSELYLSACVFGQYKRTQCVPAAFPLFLEEKLVFEKVFTDVVDPGELVELLEFDTAVLELIQLVPPVGEILATYEENTRDFLFPDPKLTRGHHGSDREVLMKRSSSFTVEHPSPTVDVHTWRPTRDSGREAWSRVSYDPSLLGSYRPKHTKMIRSHHGKDLDGSSDSCDEHPISGTASRHFHSTSSLIRSAPSSLQKHSSSPVLNRSSLRERFNTGWSTPANGEEIHKRVKNILRTHSARQRLTFDESNSSKGDSSKTREVSCKDSLCGSELQSSSSVQQNTTVHLDNGEYWSNRAAAYKGKPHRAIFEDSLEKIYRNMYKKASGTISKRKIHS